MEQIIDKLFFTCGVLSIAGIIIAKGLKDEFGDDHPVWAVIIMIPTVAGIVGVLLLSLIKIWI